MKNFFQNYKQIKQYNRIFRILYNTIFDVQGINEEEVFHILCRNLQRITKAQYTVLASFDHGTKLLTLKAINNEK